MKNIDVELSSEETKEAVYYYLTMLPDEPTKESRKWVVEQAKASIKQVVACEAVLKGGGARDTLAALGYTEPKQLPPWIRGEQQAATPAATSSATTVMKKALPPPPTTPPPTAGAAAKAAAATIIKTTSTSPLVLPSMHVLDNEDDAATQRAAARRDFVGGAEVLDSDAENFAASSETSREPFNTSPLPVYDILSDGTPVELVRLADGGTAYIRRKEQTPRSEAPDVGSRISEMMWANVDVNTQTIMRKVGLNPDVFQCYSWLKSKVDPETLAPIMRPNMDIGDFINWCVKYTMLDAFGFVPGMVAVGPGNIRRFMEARTRGEHQNA